MINTFWRWARLAAIALAVTAPAVQAQELDEGTPEVVGFAGVITDGGDGIFGAGFGSAVRPRWLVIGELAWIPIENSAADGVEFNLNAHYLFPLRDYPRFTPYLLGGLGFMHVSSGGGGRLGRGGGDTDVGLNLGGGARWQAGRNWGLRPEIKFFISDGSYTRLSVGIYYQFGRGRFR